MPKTSVFAVICYDLEVRERHYAKRPRILLPITSDAGDAHQ